MYRIGCLCSILGDVYVLVFFLRVWFLQETMNFFLDENHLWGKKKKWFYFLVHIFHFGCHCRIPNYFLGFSGFQNTKTTFHLFTSKPIKRNALKCTCYCSFCFSWGAPRRGGLWRPWPGEEKHLQLAQLQQDGGHPACKVQAVLRPIHQPPAAGEAVHLSYVSY